MASGCVAAAHHEAGHAVIARVLGLAGGYATIFPDTGSAGHVIIDDPWSMLDRWDAIGRHRSFHTALRALIISYMAGAEAEIAILGGADTGDGDDRRQIERMLLSLLPAQDQIGNYERRLRQWTNVLVRRHWNCIVLVAGQLIRREYLSGDEVDRLMRQLS